MSSLILDTIERRTRGYGEELFARLDRQGPLPLTPAWWDQELLAWTMHNQAVKLQLFRFIDVLPRLQGPETVCRHLGEYFAQARSALPSWLRLGLPWLPRSGFLARLLAWLARGNAQRLARHFIAGANLEEALAALAQLQSRQLAFTIDLLGEATITEQEARQDQQDYLAILDGLGPAVNSWPSCDRSGRASWGPLPRVNVSLKLSSLYSQFDPIDPEGTSAVVKERLRPIFRTARRHGAFVNIDMEQHAFKDLTLHIFRAVLDEPEFRDWPDAGIALQAYLHECEQDLHDLADWARRRGTPVGVRLIKGAYWDYQTVIAAQEGWPVPVFLHKHQTDANYEKLTLLLLQSHDVLRPALGSHNVRSLAHALAAADVLQVPPGTLELQLLYGMADPIMDALVSLGQRVRVYTPYGELLPGMAYLVRRLLENTANESFLRASFTEHASEEVLLMNPLEQGSGVRGQGSEDCQAARRATRASRVEPAPFRNEPLSDFSRADQRLAMQQALAEVKQQLGQTYPLVIGAQREATANTSESINPSHGREVVGRCAQARPAQAAAAVAAARAALANWRDTEPSERAEYLCRAAAVMRRRRFELAAWQVYECGKGWREADADVAEAIDYCAYYASEMLRLSRPLRRDVPGEENEYFYEPRGVAVVISPWNFPLAIPCGMAAAALVTGNTVILKPAEPAAVNGSKLVEVFQEAGLPPGVLNFLPGRGREIGPTLCEHPDVDLIAFTGSRAVGLLLNRQAAAVTPGQDHVKRVLAEMGGKNAIIIDDDADLDEAVRGVTVSAFGYQGQKCSACSRVLVLPNVHDAFLARLIEATKSLQIGPAEEPGNFLGPVINAEARQRILDCIDQGQRQAKLVYAGDVGPLATEGFFVGPHIFADVPPTAAIAREEIFGPVLSVIKAANLDEALRIANGVDYALTGGLYSRSPEHIRQVRRRFRVGNLYINRKITGALVDRQPFGGFKLSGIGSKAGGPDYLLQFVLPRTITENTMRRGFAPETEMA